MTTRTTFLFDLCIASLVGLLAAIAVVVGPANANKDPVTPEQLKAYEDAFMEQVKKGDLLFHGDAATAKQMNVDTLQHGNGLRDVPSHCLRHPSARVPEVSGAA